MRASIFLASLTVVLLGLSPLDVSAGWRCRPRLWVWRQPVRSCACDSCSGEVGEVAAYAYAVKYCAIEITPLDAGGTRCNIKAVVCLNGTPQTTTVFPDRCSNWNLTDGTCNHINCKGTSSGPYNYRNVLLVDDVTLFLQGDLAQHGMPPDLALAPGWESELVKYTLKGEEKPYVGQLITLRTATRTVRYVLPATRTDERLAMARSIGEGQTVAPKADVVTLTVEKEAIKVVAFRAEGVK